MRWAGAKSAAWRTCSPRTWISMIADHRRVVQEFWNSPVIASTAGAESGRPVRRHPRRPRQSRVDHGDQSGRQPAGCRPRTRSAATLRAGGRVGLRRSTPTRPRSRTSCCPPPAGARRTARSPIPSDASRDSAPSCQCPAKPSRTGGSSAKSPAAWVTRQPSLSKPRTRFSWSTPPCPARRTTAGARSTSAA